MTKKRSKKPKEFEFKGFVNLDWPAAEKETIADWLKAFAPDVGDSLVVLAEAGYKVGVSYNDFHSAFHVAATCKVEGSKYCGRCFTLVHSDPGRGINIMRYFYDSHLAPEHYEVEGDELRYDW